MRGSKPVRVESVTKESPAYEAGICPGDMVIQVNGQSMKRCSKTIVDKAIEGGETSVKLKLIAGNSAIKRFKNRYPTKTTSQQRRVRDFFKQVHSSIEY